jgi:hypothetical protein
MENFRREQGHENSEKSIIALNKNYLGRLLWGRTLESGVQDLIKVFAVIRHVQEKAVRNAKSFKEMASDLFKEFNISIFSCGDIFTTELIDQILKSKPVEELLFEFNGIPLTIRRDSTVGPIIQEWKKAAAQDPVEKEKREVEKKEYIKTKQETLDQMITELDTLDFSNLENVVDWLYKYNKHIIQGVNDHEEILIEKFKAKGYSPEKNDKIEFMLGETLKDKRRFGEAMVGFMLQNLGLIERNKEMKKIIDDWKKSYF